MQSTLKLSRSNTSMHLLWIHRSKAEYSCLQSYFSLQSTLKLFKFISRIFDFRRDISQTCRPAMLDRTTSSPQRTFYSLPPTLFREARRQQRPYGAALQEQLEATWPRTFQEQLEATWPRTFQEQLEATWPRTFQEQLEATWPRTFQEQLEATWPRTFLVKNTAFIQTTNRPAVLKRRRRKSK